MKTVNNLIEFEKNSLQQAGEDIINFARPLAITDDSRQWNMTKYDIDSLDISKFDGTVTADHGQTISDVIGKVINLRKEGNKVLIDGIKFAIKENPLAVLAKNLMNGGFVTGVSIETIGDEPDDTLTWKNHKLAGLSIVAHPNNANAYAVIANSLQEAKKLGLNTNGLELLEKEKSIYFSDDKDYNKIMNKGGNPYHAKDGKFTTASGGSNVSSAKERYERAKTMYDNIDSVSQQKGSEEEKEYIEAKKAYQEELKSKFEEEKKAYWDILDDISLEETEFGGDTSHLESVAQEHRERMKEIKAEYKLLTESSAERFERERQEAIDKRWKEEQEAEARRIKTLAPEQRKAEEEAKKAAEKSYKEMQKKIDAITKKFGNFISSQIQDNSNRLTKILNAQSKGNPYHDKLGKFTSGPLEAFGIFARSQEFRHIEEPTVKSAARSIFPTSGPNDEVMTSMTDEQIIATYECEIATIGVGNFNRNAEVTHKEAPKELLSLNDRISNNASVIYEEIGKFARGTGREKGIKESKLKSALNVIEKMTNDSQKCADLVSKMKVPETENYAKRLVIEGNDALQAVYSTLKYISKNTEDEVRYFTTK